MNIITYLLNLHVDILTRNNKYFCNHKGHNMQKTFENELLKALGCRLSHFSLSRRKREHAKVSTTCNLEPSAIFS